jgi:outer membrane protein TolC
MKARIVLPLLLIATSASAQQRKLTVEEAVKTALENNPALRALQSRVEAARDTANSVRGRYGFVIDLNDEVQHWNTPFAIPFPIGAALVPVVLPLYQHDGIPLPAGLTQPSAFPVRQIDTNTFAATLNQPLMGLLEISQNHLTTLDNAAAAAANEHALENNIREAVETQYLRLYEARATEDIARTSQQQLNEQLTVARSKLAAGVLTNADVLRVVVAVANARQQEIQAQAAEQVAHAAILAQLNMAATDETLDFAEPTELETAPAPPALAEAVAIADRDRPELDAAHHVQAAAGHQSLGTIFHLLPAADFEAGYLHVTGQEFAEVNSEYVGFKFNWPIWTWGADYYNHKAAAAQAVAAELDTENLRLQIGQDLSSKLSVERSSTVAVDVAQTAITSAQEAFRVTEALVKAGSATTTDLLDSQSALTQASLNLVRARYEQAIARVAVRTAMGGAQ